jgi:hypothetical protein
MVTQLRMRKYRPQGGPTRWRVLCLCSCGRKFFTWKHALASGNTKSCGCLRNTRIGTRARKYTEGFSSPAHPLNWLYQRWSGMWERCTDPCSTGWANYGGRGITVCESWRSFEAFVEDMGVPARHLTLDRCDNDEGYSPDNCRWATAREQALNQRERKPGAPKKPRPLSQKEQWLAARRAEIEVLRARITEELRGDFPTSFPSD